MSKVRAALAFSLLLAAACGGDGGEDLEMNDPDVDVNSPECRACAATLSSESASCGATLDTCTNNVNQYTDAHIACFQVEGRCQDAALDKASSCHRACGDVEQANVETCGGECFLTRAACAEATLRRVDSCLDLCTGADCAVCTVRGESDFDTCNNEAQTCANVCVMTYRSS
jgi:hypothetical protein